MTPEERFERIEDTLSRWIEQSKKDYEENKALWRETRSQIEALNVQMAETDRRMQSLTEATNGQIQETTRHLEALGKATDRRIEKLVSAIAELIQRLPPVQKETA